MTTYQLFVVSGGTSTPLNGQTLEGPTRVVVKPATGIKSVQFSIDGKAVGQDSAKPFKFDFDPADFGPGSHDFMAAVTLRQGVAPVLIESFNVAAPAKPKAFPTAYGFGASTRGAFGGPNPPIVLFVTNLNDSGPGSLRAAVQDPRPRVVIFRTGGTIQALSPIVVGSPFVTFAGQTAPGGGICVRNGGTNKVGPFRVEHSDVVLRFMRFRGGFITDPSNLNHSIDMRASTFNNPIERVICDHVSASWGTDMNMMTGANAGYITIQNCLISECLRNASSQGQHNRGLNHRYDGSGEVNSHFSDIRNVFSMHEYRTPQLSDVTDAEVINNIVNKNASLGMNVNADAHGHVVAMTARYEHNYFKRFSGAGGHREHQLSTGYGPDTKIYVKGTVGFTRTSELDPEQDAKGYPIYVDESDKALKRADGTSVWTQTDRSVVPDSEHPPPMITATAAYKLLVEDYITNPDVGACRTLDGPNPDLTDRRVMADVMNGTGDYIDRPWDPTKGKPGFDSTGFPILAAGTPPVDSNNDGIPDAWPLPSGKTAMDVSDSGYTYLENYLNFLAGDLV